jgi:polyketide synthase PksN
MNSNGQHIAVIGMASRVPGANNYEDYWGSLLAGNCSISEIPKARWSAQNYFSAHTASAGKTVSKWGGYLDDIESFDPAFFGISPREAASLDPQQKILLLETWRALEDSGIRPSTLRGRKVGVFVAAMSMDQYARAHAAETTTDKFSCLGTYAALIANRISFHFGFEGPSFTLDSACSGSLTALHLACKSLRDRECDVAVVGAVSLNFDPFKYVSFSNAGMLSPTGQCRPLDSAANGYVPGEGACVLVMQRSIAALNQRRRVHLMVRGSAISHVGSARSITSPSMAAQAAVLQAALDQSGTPASAVSYLELHGTGTPLGDPIEVAAAKLVYGRVPATGSLIRACYIGSVKANVGHLEAAAGLASIVKVAMMMRHCIVPPQINFDNMNPLIDLDSSRLTVSKGASDWLSSEGARIAGVSAMGFGGTNGHVILEEPPLQHGV